MDDPKEFGRELADRAYLLIRDEGLRGGDMAALFASAVSSRAHQMESEGTSRDAIAEWIGQVTEAYGERVDDLVRSLSAARKN
ncbi:MAG TPA: hypothetical protein VG758_09865 [Hyphomicrobiaceae bacterium]|jgi:hypothetical protein|nr:hypothetical protein [Hyphomicrobiaceae bacterium]